MRRDRAMSRLAVVLANLEHLRESAYELAFLFMDPPGNEDLDGEDRYELLEDMKAELHATMIALDEITGCMEAMKEAELAEGEGGDDDDNDEDDDDDDEDQEIEEEEGEGDEAA